jgi:hypothetical protein
MGSRAPKKPRLKVTTEYIGSVSMSGEAKPTLDDLEEFLGAAYDAGAKADAEVRGGITSNSVFEGNTLVYKTYTNLAVDVPAGPQES